MLVLGLELPLSTVFPSTPGAPAAPDGPAGPCAPALPAGPCVPEAPATPCDPEGPWGPTKETPEGQVPVALGPNKVFELVLM